MQDDILLPRILLTNDDGIDAPGLAMLAKIAAPFAQEIWIVAPDEDQSGASQRISLRQPLKVTPRGERSFAVTGTPSDCVALALDHLMADARPNLVLSGINSSTNIGDEVGLSGTVGAAMTALMLGVPAIAISQQEPARGKTPWETSAHVLPSVLERLLDEGWRKETCLCVNIPDYPPDEIKGYAWARQGHKNVTRVNSSRRISPRGEEYFWLSLERKDPVPLPTGEAAILSRGEVAITALSLDRSLEIAKPPVRFKPRAELVDHE
ncbi:MAG TPA: 5'/3'-nucleotidase SurE [Rhodospirillaceae bacterium]|nr:5'/3'-nucleotidase SurE [Rhodospirillaceae bacterium]